MLDIGLLVLRVVVGGLIAAHGLQKLAGWFGGAGVDGNAAYLRELGYPRPRALSRLHGVAETGGGLLLALGLLTPLAVAAVVAVMLNAIVAVHGRNGLWAHEGGFELPLTLGLTAAGIALTGPGAVALDTAIGWQPGLTGALAAIVGGVVVGAVVLGLRRPSRAPQPESTTRRETPAAAA